MTLQDLKDKITVWDSWKIRYQKHVPDFIKEASTKNTVEQWDQEIFSEFFEKSNNHCVSSLQQGYFSYGERELIKANWHELAPHLKIIADNQDKPLYKVYRTIKSIIRKHTAVNRIAATNRLIASLQPKLLCTVVNESKLTHLMSLMNENIDQCNLNIGSDWFENSFNVQQYYKANLDIGDPYEFVTCPWQIYLLLLEGLEHFVINDMSEGIDIDMNGLYAAEINLLKYKHQIILQGPPGTGKTRLAKKIAEGLCSGNKILSRQIPITIDESIIKEYCSNPINIKSSRDGINYRILGLETIGVKVESSKGTPYVPKFDEIATMYKNKSWQTEGQLKGGNDSYSAAVAKYIHQQFELISDYNKEEYIKIIQFHPSYTYEDFVRGITSKIDPESQQITYEAEDKIIGKLSKIALENYQLNQNHIETTSSNPNFNDFYNHIIEVIDQHEKFMLSENVYIFYVDERRFKYKGDNWTAHPNGLNMNFSELMKIINLNLDTRQKINKETSLNALTRQHASYYQKFNELFRSFEQKRVVVEKKINSLNNYVLIIDEINRANLPSVLGELIFGLEYRGEKIESMYEVDGTNTLILPPNLYVIGTMNTADRSVGHIDYAVRRRFSFVNVLPQIIKDLDGLFFDIELFTKVSNLFVDNFMDDIDYSSNIGNIKRSFHLSTEFNPEDVWLGHSYFIHKDAAEMEIRWAYEIKPILLEYLKDGVLKETAKSIINNILVN